MAMYILAFFGNLVTIVSPTAIDPNINCVLACQSISACSSDPLSHETYCKYWQDPPTCFGIYIKSDGTPCFHPNDSTCDDQTLALMTCDGSVAHPPGHNATYTTQLHTSQSPTDGVSSLRGEQGASTTTTATTSTGAPASVTTACPTTGSVPTSVDDQSGTEEATSPQSTTRVVEATTSGMLTTEYRSEMLTHTDVPSSMTTTRHHSVSPATPSSISMVTSNTHAATGSSVAPITDSKSATGGASDASSSMITSSASDATTATPSVAVFTALDGLGSTSTKMHISSLPTGGIGTEPTSSSTVATRTTTSTTAMVKSSTTARSDSSDSYTTFGVGIVILNPFN